MWSVQENERGDRICLREKTSCSGDADLTTVEGIQKQVQMFTGISANTETIEATGKTLQLQIGDMHAEAPGLKDLKIDAPERASAAIQTIENAVNQVFSVRGDLGAAQNRLEHTANNLSVMAENIQDAESTIRDTDAAEKMMAYTKNNILIRSAQAMLAQANAVPQGVLRLLG